MTAEGKVVVVTAAAGAGVGRAIAQRFVSEGATVVISDAHAKRLPVTAAELGVEGEVVDVGDSDALVAHLEGVMSRHGRIDVLVSCAGINTVAPAWELEPSDWRRILEVNLTAPFMAARAVLPSMVERQSGSIINISSIAAWLPSEGECAYQATKAGLLGLTRALAFEAAPFGVRVNAIAPGLVDNPFLARLYGEEHVARLQSRIPMKRSAHPAEIAGAAFWLASDDAAYITGECLTLAGGWYMRP